MNLSEKSSISRTRRSRWKSKKIYAILTIFPMRSVGEEEEGSVSMRTG
jgi:hypothetical protein